MDDLVKRIREFAIHTPLSKPMLLNAADRIEALEARIAKTDALVEALTQIANAPSEMTWGEEDEVNATMNRMKAIADAALIVHHEGSEK